MGCLGCVRQGPSLAGDALLHGIVQSVVSCRLMVLCKMSGVALQLPNELGLLRTCSHSMLCCVLATHLCCVFTVEMILLQFAQ